jgi:hypothetical protein
MIALRKEKTTSGTIQYRPTVPAVRMTTPPHDVRYRSDLAEDHVGQVGSAILRLDLPQSLRVHHRIRCPGGHPGGEHLGAYGKQRLTRYEQE